MIVSICGASGSGKSILAKTLAREYTDCERVPTDYFIKPASLPLTVYLQQPIAYDWDLFDKTISHPIGTTITTPNFDFGTFQRIDQTGGKPFCIANILITDGFYPHPRACLRILLTCKDSLRSERLVKRDQVWQTHVLQRWEKLERCHEQLKDAYKSWDLILSGEVDPLVNARQIIMMMIDNKHR